ncbi:hypothetical protein DFH08DRAFT_483181 [Mycena albidolilacea]|uniref:Uncharacterized protein n=1 Tax=Mycena albidolilacea TaxID=1033008 RepID=A0AAD6Z694_9AGAR|nr:hypothetical protein DFH08DRAFT_483181 [Mycena albidolilacea]
MITYPDTGTHRWSLARVDVSFDWTRMPSGKDIAVGAAFCHGGHDIIVARTSARSSVRLRSHRRSHPQPQRSGPQAHRTSTGSLPLGLAPVARSSQAVSVPPSLARTPRPSPPSCSAPLYDGHLLACIPFLGSGPHAAATRASLSARVCTRIRIGILVPLHLMAPHRSPHLLLSHPAYRPSPHTPPPRSARAGPPRHSPPLNARPHARPEDLFLRALPPPRAPTTKPKLTSSVARPAPRPMGSATVLPTTSPGESSRCQFCAGDIDTGRHRAFHLTATDSIDTCRLR